MLSSAEITAMRAQQFLALPDSVVIQRRTLAADGAGGQTETWTTLATVAGRLSVETRVGRETPTGGRLASVTPYRVTLPAQTDVTARDRLVVGSRTFDVALVQAGGAWETARVCLCAEVL